MNVVYAAIGLALDVARKVRRPPRVMQLTPEQDREMFPEDYRVQGWQATQRP